MGAFIHGISVAYRDNRTPIQIAVRYTDNGYTDSIVKTFDDKMKALLWLRYWDGDTSGGFDQLEHARTVVKNLVA